MCLGACGYGYLLKTNKSAQQSKINSIINEFRNYEYWQSQKKEICLKLDELEKQLYCARGISYDQIPQKNRNYDQESLLIELIERKSLLEQKIILINEKENFLYSMLHLMSEKDKLFIESALMYRSVYDTNGSIAMRYEITESGVRYKVNTIIKNAYKAYMAVDSKEKEGGIIESITV